MRRSRSRRITTSRRRRGLYRHFSTVADKVGLPVVLYNVPGRSGVPIAEATVARLAKNPVIMAVKEAAGQRGPGFGDSRLVRYHRALRRRFADAPMMSVGAKGIISVSSNLIPGEMSAMVRAALEGDFAKAYAYHRKYYPFFRDQFVETNPIPIKAAMAMAGSWRRSTAAALQNFARAPA